MTSFSTSDQFPHGIIARQGIDTDTLTVGGLSVVQGGPTGPTGPTGSVGATGPTGPAISTASPTFTGTTTVSALTSTGVILMTLGTTDPHVIGRLWANAGVVTVSAG